MYHITCTKCSSKCETPGLCPKCGPIPTLLEFREVTTISGGAGTVNIPAFSKNPNQTIVTTTGEANVSFGSVKKNYKFSLINVYEENDTHYVKIRTKDTLKDGHYLDIIFGQRSDKPHAHFGHKVSPQMLFSKNRIQGNQESKHFYDKDDGAFLPIEKVIEDKDTSTKVCMKFVFNNKTNLVDLAKVTFEKI